MSLNIALPSPSGIVFVANSAFSLEHFQCIEGRSAPRGFYPAAVSSANRGIRCTSAPALSKGTRSLRLPRRASRRRALSGGGGGALHIANAALRREPGATNNNGDGNEHPDGHAKVASPHMGRAEERDKSFRGADENRTEYNRTINARTGGRVLTPQEHWQRYRPQLATRYGHWRFWLPAQGREAKLSLELLREITPVEVESGADEYVLRQEQFNRQGDFPAKVAEGAWPFSCEAAGRLLLLFIPLRHLTTDHLSYFALHPPTQHEQFNRRGDFPSKVAEAHGPSPVLQPGDFPSPHPSLSIPPHSTSSSTDKAISQPSMGGGTAWEGGQHGRGDSMGGGTAWEGGQHGRGDSMGGGTAWEGGQHGRGDSMGGGTARRAVLLTANVCFMDGPGAQLNVAFSEASLSLRQDDTVLPTGSRNNDHTARRYQATDGSTNPSGQSLHGTWVSPHWKTPLPTHLPASLPPLPPKPLYGVPHYIYTDLYATPLPEHPNKRLETQNMEVFSGYLAGIPEAQQTKYGVWALPRGVVVAMPSPLEPMLSREGGGEGEEFWLVVTYVRGGGEGVQGGSDGVSEDRGGVELGGGEGEEGGGIEDTGYMADGEWKVQQVMVAYDALGRFEYVKHTRFM
ncbi:unnamed protein product [Closterium sp. Naga37s-1]|nr:unnamed protein product [Closterium sp. Naga37s-1]